jgi:hypothetical protein
MSVAKGLAEKILAPVQPGKAFHFYLDVGMPLGVSVSSLGEFGAKLKTVEIKSLEFHAKRGDFEKWVYMLGDGELAKSLINMRETNASGEKLRAELVRMVQTRARQLQRSTLRK